MNSLNNDNMQNIFLNRSLTESPEHILELSKAESGGKRDMNFLKYLIDSRLLKTSESILKRTNTAYPEEYYLDRYKKASFESDRHFLCRAAIMDELDKMGKPSVSGLDMGEVNILRENSSYDIVTKDFSLIFDIGLTPARNYFRGLTDRRVQSFLITTYFDDYMDDIIFSVFSRANDTDFINAVKDYEEGFKQYTM